MKSTLLQITFLLIALNLLGQEIQEAKGGEIIFETYECLSQQDYDFIEKELAKSSAELRENGILPSMESRKPAAITKLAWPLRQADGFTQPDYYTTINYVDLDNTSQIQDFECGGRSYDGHRGFDVSLWPYWWKMMDENHVEVIAGAPGTIIFKQDGNFDQNCTCTGTWNAVYVEHADGSVAWYGHLKTGTLLDKAIGETVAEGDYIGVVGSSGCSSNPHLHLEIRDENNNYIEAFAGDCNNTATETWWKDQKPYREPALNLLMTHSVQPAWNGFCPDEENIDYKTDFDFGELIYFGAYYRDQIASEMTAYQIVDPEGNLYNDWMHSSSQTYSNSWWYWNFSIPSSYPAGVWKFRGNFMGQMVEHEFNVGMFVSTNDPTFSAVDIYPNPASDWINIVPSSDEQMSFSIVNIAGSVVIKENLTNHTRFNIDKLTPGVYQILFYNKQKEQFAAESLVVLD